MVVRAASLSMSCIIYAWLRAAHVRLCVIGGDGCVASCRVNVFQNPPGILPAAVTASSPRFIRSRIPADSLISRSYSLSPSVLRGWGFSDFNKDSEYSHVTLVLGSSCMYVRLRDVLRKIQISLCRKWLRLYWIWIFYYFLSSVV